MNSKQQLSFPISVWLTKLAIAALIVCSFTYVIASGKFGASIHWRQNFANWDGGWYLHIAEHGYNGATNLTAFFPVYPILIYIFHSIFHVKYVLSGILVANFSFLFALIFLYRLVSIEQQDEEIAKKTLWLLFAFPAALFFNMTYTESTNLLFLVLFFYFLQKDKWYLALISGALATLTHDLGIILSVSALIYWWKNKHLHSTAQRILRFFSIGIIPAGLAFYMIFLWIHTGSPITFIQAQAEWYRQAVVPIYSIIHLLIHLQSSGDANYKFLMYVNGLSTLFFAALAIPMILDKKIKLEQTVFYILTLLACVVSGTGGDAQSYARFMVVLFPGFIVLAKQLKNQTLFMSIMLFMFSIEIILTGMFADGYWVT